MSGDDRAAEAVEPDEAKDRPVRRPLGRMRPAQMVERAVDRSPRERT